MKPKVSIIVPVYNCEKYLSEALESLLNQSMQEIEIIVVNDGSTDNSSHIANKYKDIDNRVKIINQDNQGVSSARNNGLQIAGGDYIGFIDGDDYIEIDYYEKLYNVAIKNNCDIVMCDWKSVLNGRENRLNLPFKKNKILDKRYIEKNIYPYFIENDSLNSVCNKIFSNKLIKENKIIFPIGVQLGEDGAFNVRAITYSDNIYYLDYCGYYYREVEGSATRNVIKKDYFKRALEVYNNKLNEYEKWPIKEEEIQRLKAIKFLNTVISLTYIYFVPNESNKLKDRYKYIKNMINSEEVCTAINKYYNEISDNRGRYEKKIIDSIKNKNIFGIYALTLYSRLRNR